MKKILGLASVAVLTLSLATQAATVRTAKRPTTMSKAEATKLLKSGQALSSAQLNAVLALKGAKEFTATVDKLVADGSVSVTEGDGFKAAYAREIISEKDAVSCLKGLVNGVEAEKSKLALQRYAAITTEGAVEARTQGTYVSVATASQREEIANAIRNSISRELNLTDKAEVAAKANAIRKNCNLNPRLGL